MRGMTENAMKNKFNGGSIPMGYTVNSEKYYEIDPLTIGGYRYSGIVNPNGVPPIIPKDLFERVQELLAKNKKAPARHKAEDDYLLTTELFCGLCAAYMVGESGTSKTGKTHHYYKCVSVRKNL